ncbi:MAG: hypothetical protein JXB49_34850 [Bacteroidales bacterium]|nr:hypothetical protein [Bacteroidales bacterium]
MGLRIDEPVTTFSDLIVSAVCFYAFIKLTQIKNKDCRTLYFFRYYFLSMSIATFIGGIVGHGFLYLLSFGWKLPGWLTSMFSIMLVERASIQYASPLIKPKVAKVFKVINLIELATFVILTFTTMNFFFVEAHSAYGLLIVVSSFNIFIYYKTRDEASRLLLIAVGISAISALIFMNKWGLCQWYNHFDISHTLMAISAWFFYRGAKKACLSPLANKNTY